MHERDALATLSQGAVRIYRRNRDGLKKANAYFEQAIALDPSYALAYAGLSRDYETLALYGYLPPGEAFPKAIAAASKAVLSTSGQRTHIPRLRIPPFITSGTGREASRNYTGRSPLTRTTQKLTKCIVYF